MAGPRKDRRDCRRLRHAQVVVTVYADPPPGMPLRHGLRHHADDVREHPAVGVAEDDPGRARFEGLVDGPHGVGRGIRPSGEEVLRVEDHFLPGVPEHTDALADQPEIFLRRGAEDFRDLIQLGLAVDHRRRDGRRSRQPEELVVPGIGPHAGSPGEDREFRAFELQVPEGFEERGVLFGGDHPGLDIGDAEPVQREDHPPPVVRGELHPHPLRPVPESGV